MSGWAFAAPVVFVPKAKASSKQPSAGKGSRGMVPSAAGSRPLPVTSSALSGRSRSPPRVGLPGLRGDAPGRLARQFAGLPQLLDPAAREEALVALDRDILAATTQRTNDARLRTIEAALRLWGIPMWPPTLIAWKALAATLKMGRYASAPVYFSTYKAAAERRGYVLDDLAVRSIKDYSRSCLRGLGAPARARPLPMDRLHLLPASRSPFVSGGPLNPRAAMMVGAWWLCREIELSNLRAQLVEFSGSRTALVATLHLPASKSDQLALGTARALRCVCSADASSSSKMACPAHVLAEHVLFLQARFPAKFVDGAEDMNFPLFPSAEGKVVMKAAMQDCIVECGRLLGINRSAPDGSERITGHSLRVTGTQGLVMRGWDLWTVQLHGRWGSDVIKRYARDSPLAAVASGRGPAARHDLDLEAVVAAVVSKLQPSERVQPAVVESAVCLRPTAGAPPLANLAAQLESARHAVVEPDPLPERFVLNTRSGTYHRRVDTSVSSAACGWAFASVPHAFVPDAEAGPKCGIQLCSRCWPSLRSVALATGGVVTLPNQSSLPASSTEVRT